ncbi:hypothetical protein [Nostoc sp. CCY0012]|uniref:hypothetical protein n=1 Tax=Nostoc sp. CCY0012 TaxID=1056123 RepID=UPI0039C6E8FA
MKFKIKVLLSSISIVVLLLTTLVVQAGGIDTFKLRYFSLTQYLHNQEQALNDLQKQNVDPAKNTPIDLNEILAGGLNLRTLHDYSSSRTRDIGVCLQCDN